MADKLGLCFFPAFDWAISPTHPEREERLLYTRDQLFEEGVMDLPGIKEYRPGIASYKDIARVHFCLPDVASQVTEAHLIAAGGAITLAEAWRRGEVERAFALVRPPGHHAMRVVHGNRGFCNINNEAIMVEYLRQKYGIRRVAIVDTDVHHGDGTQDIYWHDPDVLFISFHQDGRTLYPGTGFTNELGGPLALARTINIPLPPGTTDEGLHYVIDNLVLPILADFAPELVVNSAGQDNHYTDPLANMRVSAQGYARLNEKLAPDIAVLEGGYAIETALPYVNLAIVLAMAGRDYSRVVEPDYDPVQLTLSPEKMDYIKRLTAQLREIWEQRDRLDWERIYGGKDFYQRSKSIYYDTSNIHEEQVEKLRLCPDCHGYLTIETTAFHSRGRKVRAYCITVPFQGCENCRQRAYDEFQAAIKKGLYDFVLIQDRVEDRYYTHNCHTGKTEEIT